MTDWDTTAPTTVFHEDSDLYEILNLNRGASLSDINERYRSLSLLFHPDRRRDPKVKEVAHEEFLKIQKAYQVLSDPFLREVYDTLGEEGLSVKWPPDLPLKSRDEIREELKKYKAENENSFNQLSDQLPPSKISATLDVTGLFNPRGFFDSRNNRVVETPLDRLKTLWFVSEQISQSFTKRINDSTVVTFEARGHVQAGSSGFIQYLGTVRHQFSPRLMAEVTTSIGRQFLTKLHGRYHDNYNTVKAEITISPAALCLPPVLEVSASRRLFRHKPQAAEISLKLGQIPSLSFNYVSPPSVTQKILDASRHGFPSVTGLQYIFFDQSFGISFMGILPKLIGEVGVTFLELATRLKLGLEWGLEGLALSIGASWSNSNSEVNASTTLHPRGIFMEIDVTHWKRKFTLPIIISPEYDEEFALWALVIPSIAAVAGYQLLVRPRRRAQRIAL